MSKYFQMVILDSSTNLSLFQSFQILNVEDSLVHLLGNWNDQIDRWLDKPGDYPWLVVNFLKMKMLSVKSMILLVGIEIVEKKLCVAVVSMKLPVSLFFVKIQ